MTVTEASIGSQEESPVFVLAGGQRAGSTLVQRLLIGTGEVMIWGEHDGLLVPHLHRIAAGMQRWLNETSDAPHQFMQFRKHGHNAWIPNISPAMPAYLLACSAFLRAALGEPARQLGYSRWGFKEVRYGMREALFLQALHPDARFVLLVRDPHDCLRSIKATAWGPGASLQQGPGPFLLNWARLSRELSEARPRLKKAVLIRYEDLVGNPGETLSQIAEACGVSDARLKQSDALGRVERGPAGPLSELNNDDLAALAHPDVARAAEDLGYALRENQRTL
jgi:hypothetical protein